jgi:hypothetical protein
MVTNKANALVAAAYRKAAEIVDKSVDMSTEDEIYSFAAEIKQDILSAIPADAGVALRERDFELCMEVAFHAVKFGAVHGSEIIMNGIEDDDLQAIVNSVLGEGGK